MSGHFCGQAQPHAPHAYYVEARVMPGMVATAIERGYSVGAYVGVLVPGVPWAFWHRLRLFDGSTIDLPPMFKITPLATEGAS